MHNVFLCTLSKLIQYTA